MAQSKEMLEAQDNLKKLGENKYLGRKIVLGVSSDGRSMVQVYGLTGRDPNTSKNRRVRQAGTRVYTEVVNPSLMNQEQIPLLIYDVMDHVNGKFVVTNGRQTTDIVSHFAVSSPLSTLRNPLETWTYETDKIGTPRISGCSSWRNSKTFMELAILKKSDHLGGDHCARQYFEYANVTPGFGFCLTTYMSDGNPPPIFTGDPYPVFLSGGIDDVTEIYWAHLNPANRVSLVVRFIDIMTGEYRTRIVNTHPDEVVTPSTPAA